MVFTVIFILLSRDHKKIIPLSRDNGSFSRDNGLIYQVSFHHVVESECVVHDHTDLAVKISASSITEV